MRIYIISLYMYVVDNIKIKLLSQLVPETIRIACYIHKLKLAFQWY